MPIGRLFVVTGLAAVGIAVLVFTSAGAQGKSPSSECEFFLRMDKNHQTAYAIGAVDGIRYVAASLIKMEQEINSQPGWQGLEDVDRTQVAATVEGLANTYRIVDSILRKRLQEVPERLATSCRHRGGSSLERSMTVTLARVIAELESTQ